jgi:hypothetical protein
MGYVQDTEPFSCEGELYGILYLLTLFCVAILCFSPLIWDVDLVDLFLYPDIIHRLSPLNRFHCPLKAAKTYIISRMYTYQYASTLTRSQIRSNHSENI